MVVRQFLTFSFAAYFVRHCMFDPESAPPGGNEINLRFLRLWDDIIIALRPNSSYSGRNGWTLQLHSGRCYGCYGTRLA